MLILRRGPIPASGARGPLEVRASLFYQAIPPRYPKDRFDHDGLGTFALHWTGRRRDASRTHLPGWKLPLGTASVVVP